MESVQQAGDFVISMHVNFQALQTYSMKDHILALGNQFYLASVEGIKDSSN